MTTLANKEGQYYISKLEAVAISNLNATMVVLPQSGAGLAQGSKPNNAVQPGLAQSRRFIQQHNMIG